jgi:glycosyltransferase involved in cell wall biosynthesis
MKKVSCIIPAYNESARIANTLRAVKPLIGTELFEVIVVDDGSTDGTGEAVALFPEVQYIKMASNGGKSRAVAAGIRAASGDTIALLDADLVGLEKRHLEALLSPIMSDEADVVISLRGNAPLFAQLISLNYISGERVFPREMIENSLDEMEAIPNLGLEVYLNQMIIARDYRIESVPWKDVGNYFKIKKYGFFVGFWKEMLMLKDMFSVIPIWGVLGQNLAMMRLLRSGFRAAPGA